MCCFSPLNNPLTHPLTTPTTPRPAPRSKLSLLWFRVNIILGPMMLDGWEKFLFYSCALTIMALLAAAIARSPPVAWAAAAAGRLVEQVLAPWLAALLQ